MELKTENNSSDRWWDLPAAFLLLVILTTAYTRLVVTDWTSGLLVTRYIVYIGLIAGLALGQSRFSARLAGFFAVIYGVFIVIWRLGMLMGEGILWSERLVSMNGRLQAIITQLIKRQAVNDSFLFLVLMAVLFWVLSVHAGYSLTRYANPWRTILPTGVALVLIHSYDSYLTSRVWYLVIFLFFALMLVARLVYLHNKTRWTRSNTYIPPYLGVDFIRITLAATALLLVLTWTTPALADSLPEAQHMWQRLKQPWNELRNTMDNAFASLRSSVGIVTDYYGPNLSLGRGNRLTNSQVFTVYVPENMPEGTRYYWRARVYDIYDNGWTSSLVTTELFDPDSFNLVSPDTADNAPGLYGFAFTIATPLSTLMTVQQVVWVSRPVKLELEYNQAGEADLASIRATPPLNAGETYNLRSTLNQVTIAEMRAAGSDYPQWVTDRYLQLPDTITPRTIELAKSIAQGKDTPYDITAAVTGYLRTNIEYTETVPPLPVNQDLVDWFLFDLKQGFCNYYATAEVVMLRTLGIPARLAVGYAQGEPIEGENAFFVLQRDSHAWPEVYFPNIGWVEFEPTVSQPTLVRPTGSTNPENGPPSNITNDENAPGSIFDTPKLGELEAREAALARASRNQAIGISGIIIGLLVVLTILLIPVARRKKIRERIPNIPILLDSSFRRFGLQPPAFLRDWARRARLSPLDRSYQEINSALTRLKQRPTLTDTPAERAATLNRALPPAGEPAHLLLAEYQAATYSRDYSPNLEAARSSGNIIRSLSYRAWLQTLVNGRKSKR